MFWEQSVDKWLHKLRWSGIGVTSASITSWRRKKTFDIVRLLPNHRPPPGLLDFVYRKTQRKSVPWPPQPQAAACSPFPTHCQLCVAAKKHVALLRCLRYCPTLHCCPTTGRHQVWWTLTNSLNLTEIHATLFAVFAGHRRWNKSCWEFSRKHLTHLSDLVTGPPRQPFVNM